LNRRGWPASCGPGHDTYFAKAAQGWTKAGGAAVTFAAESDHRDRRERTMNFSHFVRIDRERRGLERHFVVHTHDPKFTLELAADPEAPDRVGRGVIKRICVPNSWAGDYGQYGNLLAAAQEFFAESNVRPAPRG
jgi:hypothetical protein